MNILKRIYIELHILNYALRYINITSKDLCFLRGWLLKNVNKR